MKKILLMIAIVFCIFQMVVLAADFDIGMPAIDRPGSFGDYTLINVGNPSDTAGTISNVEIYALDNLLNCEVGIFYNVGGLNFSTRDTQAIGTVTSGAKKTFAVDLDVEIGDYIGLYYTSGNIERDTSGFDGVWFYNGDAIPADTVTFSLASGDAVSLYGTGATIPVGWPHEWNTKAISKWNTKEFSKWNGLE